MVNIEDELEIVLEHFSLCAYYCRDLKRDVATKLEKLEKRTQRAIVELIRE